MITPEDYEHVLTKGWGELHPYARDGRAPATTTMVFAPRDEAEVEVVLEIARASRRFVGG